MLSGRSATVESQPLPSLTQLLGSPGEAEVLLEQPQLFITGMRIFKRGRRSEVEYLMSFPAFPGQDDWYAGLPAAHSLLPAFTGWCYLQWNGGVLVYLGKTAKRCATAWGSED